MKKYFILMSVLLLLCGTSNFAEAALTADGARGLVYDSDQGITWLQDSSQLGASNYYDAFTIIFNLNSMNAGAGYLGYN
jgi:hypothetical protein